MLDDLIAEAGSFPFPDPQYYPVLAKALLVHGTGWGDLRARNGITKALQTSSSLVRDVEASQEK